MAEKEKIGVVEMKYKKRKLFGLMRDAQTCYGRMCDDVRWRDCHGIGIFNIQPCDFDSLRFYLDSLILITQVEKYIEENPEVYKALQKDIGDFSEENKKKISNFLRFGAKREYILPDCVENQITGLTTTSPITTMMNNSLYWIEDLLNVFPHRSINMELYGDRLHFLLKEYPSLAKSCRNNFDDKYVAKFNSYFEQVEKFDNHEIKLDDLDVELFAYRELFNLVKDICCERIKDMASKEIDLALNKKDAVDSLKEYADRKIEEVSKKLDEKRKEANGILIENSKSSIDEVFGDLFNPKEKETKPDAKPETAPKQDSRDRG